MKRSLAVYCSPLLSIAFYYYLIFYIRGFYYSFSLPFHLFTEEVTHGHAVYSKLLYKMGHYFLDI